MANKKFFEADLWSAAARRTAGILSIVLVFSLVLAGCRGGHEVATVGKVVLEEKSAVILNGAPQIDLGMSIGAVKDEEGNILSLFEEEPSAEYPDPHDNQGPSITPATDVDFLDLTENDLEEYLQKDHRWFTNNLAQNASRAGYSENDIMALEAAQYVSFTDTIYSGGWSLRDETRQYRETRIQTNYFVYSVYSFDSKKDYYIVEQEIILPNSNLWGGMRKEWNGVYYRSKDFWMNKLSTNNTISKGTTLLDGNLSITQYSPETVNGSTQYSSESSGNIGGLIGLSGKDGPNVELSGGGAWSSSTTWNVQDIAVMALVNDDASTKNAKWEWKTNKVCYYLSSIDISEPADLAKSTARFGATWVWVVDKPGTNDEYTLNATIGGKHSSTAFYSTGADMSQRDYAWSFDHSFVLTAPPRVQ